MIKILLSGGHLTPALAVIDQAKADKLSVSFVFLGRTYSQESNKQLSQEQTEVEKRNIPFTPTVAPKFHKTFWWRNFAEITKFPMALGITWKTIKTEKPDVFLSFGGYLAFPIALVCRLKRIPVITHEQTTERGLANQVIAFISDKIAVSHSSSLELFSPDKTVLTGNPIRPAMLDKQPKRPDWLPGQVRKNILYITGGNQGSELLNTVVEQTLPTLLQNWFIIHQCGNPSRTSNYEQRLEQAREKLPKSLQSNYIVRRWIEVEDLAWIYQKAYLVVSRSGANTTQELALHHTPSLLIPLPFSHNNEQQKNAETLENAGTAVILLQKDLTPDVFLRHLEKATNQHDKMVEKAKEYSKTMNTDAAELLLNLAKDLVKQSKQR